jgi:DNA-binding phage protein
MCVTVHALLSALVRRVAHDGYAPTRAELATLLRAGCSREDLERALSSSEAPAFEAARATLAQLPRG